MSMRSRLSVLMVVVAIVTLAAADLAIYVVVSRHLERQLDQQVRALVGVPAVRGALENEGTPQQPSSQTAPARLDSSASGAWVEVRDNLGDRVGGGFILSGGDGRQGPVFSGAPSTPEDATFLDGELQGEDGSIPYRGLVIPLEGGKQLLAALPATELRDTKRQIVLVEAVASAAVLGVTLALAWLLAGVGLRPLRRIEAGAERIAAGDLTERVEPANKNTEIGRLGAALNTMLDRIEEAFDARHESELRLRRFVADASHDLRTPLTSISGYAEMLARPGIQPDEREGAVRRIREETTRLRKLVDDLLLLARLDQHTPLNLRETDVTHLVRDLVADLRAAAPGRPIVYEASELVMADVDPEYFTRAVTNLLANANQHTPPGTQIEVRVHPENAKVAVEVEDHGPGIDADVRDRLFERFQRGDPSRSSATGGSGLGLSIAAAVAAAHGGRCELRRTDENGTTLTLVVPAHHESALVPEVSVRTT